MVRGLPKVRPILLVAKILVPIHTPIDNGPFRITNSFLFNKEILDQDATLVMGSLDVDALFTSIPLDETINIILGPLSNRIQKQIKNVFQEVIPWGKINLTFKTQSRV